MSDFEPKTRRDFLSVLHSGEPTAMSALRPCWRCNGLSFWRSREGVIHCAHCHPAAAHYIIAARLRAAPALLSALERALCYLRTEIKDRQAVSAKAIIAGAKRFGIAPATLTRARWQLGLRSKRTRQGWLWVQPR